MQGATLNGASKVCLEEEAVTSGELNGITMFETGYIKLTPKALEALAGGDVTSITLQGKNKSCDVDVSLEGWNIQ